MAPAAAALRFDGLYASRGDDATRWLRFYADGTVVAASTLTDASLDDVAVWLQKGHEYSGVGRYEVTGAALRFSETTAGTGTVHYVGSIAGVRLHLRWHSDINGADGEDHYEFARVAGW